MSDQDENGQMLEMTDEEIKDANEHAILNCHVNYADNKDLLTEAISTLDEDTIGDLVYFLKERALGDRQKLNREGLNLSAQEAFDKMGSWLFNTHSI